MSRPEYSGPPDFFYGETEAAKYTSNSHIIAVQSLMAERALELLALPEDQSALLLDIGCGSGLSGDILSEAGHEWIGIDISTAMLKIAQNDREVRGDLILKDMGDGLPFRPGTFDGAISISAIQWLCHSNSRNENPRKRLLRFFQSLYACLGRGARAVFQFYPENTKQSEFISDQAVKAGFSGGLVIDYPNSTKAKKLYLVLMTGGMQQLPRSLTSEQEENSRVRNAERRRAKKNLRKRKRGQSEIKKEITKQKGMDMARYRSWKRRRIF